MQPIVAGVELLEPFIGIVDHFGHSALNFTVSLADEGIPNLAIRSNFGTTACATDHLVVGHIVCGDKRCPALRA